MNILAIDTTTKKAAIAIQKKNKIYEDSLTNEITHSEKLLPLIANSLDTTNLNLHDLDLLGLINGPGSFTGIRIGIATLKAFAQVNNLNIFSISSTMLIAYKAYIQRKNSQYFVSLIDAKNNRVYFSINKILDKSEKIVISNIYETDNLLIDDAMVKIKEICKDKSIDLKSLVFAGNAINNFKLNLISHNFLATNLLDIYPTPIDLINLYNNISDPNKYLFNAFSLDANYARKSQAERMREYEK
ncbi:MAG: tRNA (adenosine(37)-N6)-threonylcarbamoyltransferase complex dimerization subunit type 1 TsaB [Clostridia bacterium]